MRYHRPQRSLKKLKAARRKLSALKPWPRPGYGELKNLSGKTYQVQKNGEWRLIKDFTKVPDKKWMNPFMDGKPASFEESLAIISKARQL